MQNATAQGDSGEDIINTSPSLKPLKSVFQTFLAQSCFPRPVSVSIYIYIYEIWNPADKLCCVLSINTRQALANVSADARSLNKQRLHSIYIYT